MKLFENKIQHSATWIFITKFILSALITYLIVSYVNATSGYWAVISVAAVSRPSITQTLEKGLMRIIGTIVGGLLGYLILILSNGNIILMSIGILLISFLSGLVILHRSLVSYAGAVLGFTSIIVISEAITYGGTFTPFIERTSLVLLGIFISYATSILINLLLKREKINFSLKAALLNAWNGLLDKPRILHAAPISLFLAVIVLITYVPWLIWHNLGGFWATITCYLIIEEHIFGIRKKALLRFASHLFAALIGLSGVLLSLYFPPARMIALIIGFILAGYLMVNHDRLTHTGNTFAIALVVMLLYGSQQIIDLEIIFSRFSYVLVGVIVGFIASWGMGKMTRTKLS